MRVFSASTAGGAAANTWLEQYFSVPSSAGSTAALTLQPSGGAVDLAYVERLDGPAGRGVPRLGITATPRFPFPVSATSAGGIDMATGAFLAGGADLALGGLSASLPLGFGRGYANQAITSSITAGTLSLGPLGPKWSHAWQYRLIVPDPGKTVVLRAPGGGVYAF